MNEQIRSVLERAHEKLSLLTANGWDELYDEVAADLQDEIKELLKSPAVSPALSGPYPYQSISPCVANTPAAPHKAGVLLITGRLREAPASEPIQMRSCVDCLYDLCESLKDGGFFELRVTAPESPSYGTHKRV